MIMDKILVDTPAAIMEYPCKGMLFFMGCMFAIAEIMYDKIVDVCSFMESMSMVHGGGSRGSKDTTNLLGIGSNSNRLLEHLDITYYKSKAGGY